MSVSKRKLRFRWRRAATLLIMAYLMYWSGVSVHHIWVIHNREQALNHKIAVVQEQNRVLTKDIQLLNNPATLRSILTGKAPLPNPNVSP